ncbi:hypothetical protein [Polaribacter sp. Hel_I_88]|uniref:hypothetical protein n=1 Tax=Polaribacter sp. Hel_I_88 TaxID=1250006 RepID=UPI0012DF7823|nr:hypothetical protein [Polaribacter sp. Hel_I_88]
MRKICGCCGSRLSIETMYKIKIPLLKKVRFFCSWCLKKEYGEFNELNWWKPQTERFEFKIIDKIKKN